jgi:hypothetical protein
MPSKKPFALAVDDGPVDLESVRQVLANAGYHVLTASDAKSAMEIFQRHADKIEVLMTDVAMSPVGGYDLAQTRSAWCPLSPSLLSPSHFQRKIYWRRSGRKEKKCEARGQRHQPRISRSTLYGGAVLKGRAMLGYPIWPHCGHAQSNAWAPPETPQSGQ